MKAWSAGKVAALSLALSSAVVMVCGYCVEDRIAAVYDYALAQRTLALKHEIIFLLGRPLDAKRGLAPENDGTGRGGAGRGQRQHARVDGARCIGT